MTEVYDASPEAIGSTIRVIVLASAAVPVEILSALAAAHEPVLAAFADFRARLEGLDLAPWIEAEEALERPLCSRCALDEAGPSGFCLDCELDYAEQARAAREKAAVDRRHITGVNEYAVATATKGWRNSA